MVTRYQNLIRFITDKKSLTKTKSGYSKSESHKEGDHAKLEPHQGKESSSINQTEKSNFDLNNRDLRKIVLIASASKKSLETF